MLVRFLLIALLTLSPLPALADILDEPCWTDPDQPCLLIGEDPQQVTDGDIEDTILPPIDHHFRVIDIFPISTFEMGTEYVDCFIQVEAVEIPDGLIVGTEADGQLYVEDFDNVLKPMDQIAVDLDTCSSPINVPEEERNVP